MCLLHARALTAWCGARAGPKFGAAGGVTDCSPVGSIIMPDTSSAAFCASAALIEKILFRQTKSRPSRRSHAATFKVKTATWRTVPRR